MTTVISLVCADAPGRARGCEHPQLQWCDTTSHGQGSQYYSSKSITQWLIEFAVMVP